MVHATSSLQYENAASPSLKASRVVFQPSPYSVLYLFMNPVLIVHKSHPLLLQFIKPIPTLTAVVSFLQFYLSNEIQSINNSTPSFALRPGWRHTFDSSLHSRDLELVPWVDFTTTRTKPTFGLLKGVVVLKPETQLR